MSAGGASGRHTSPERKRRQGVPTSWRLGLVWGLPRSSRSTPRSGTRSRLDEGFHVLRGDLAGRLIELGADPAHDGRRVGEGAGLDERGHALLAPLPFLALTDA